MATARDTPMVFIVCCFVMHLMYGTFFSELRNIVSTIRTMRHLCESSLVVFRLYSWRDYFYQR